MDWNGSGSLGSTEHFSSSPSWRLSVPRSLSAWKVRAAQSTGGPNFQSVHQNLLFQRWLFHTFVKRKKWKYELNSSSLFTEQWTTCGIEHLSFIHIMTGADSIKKPKSDLLGLFSGFPLFHSISISIPGTGPPEICHLKSAIFAHGTTDVFDQITWDAMWPIFNGAAWKWHHDNVN